MTVYQVLDPTTGEVLERFPTATDEEVFEALKRSHHEYSTSWRQKTVDERAKILIRVAEIYESRSNELALIIKKEMGKHESEGNAEALLSANIYRYFAEHAAKFLEDEPLRASAPNDNAYIQRKPVGSVLGIMPWNFPYYQVARFAAPNLALGNTVLLKHAPQCPRSAQVMEEIFHEAGIPQDAYINVYATNEQVADIILPSPLNHGVSLTGSERAGTEVAAIAGKHLKKVVLELGGSDPYVILDTQDVAGTAKMLFKERMLNNGQVCSAPKRMIVMDTVYQDLARELCGIVKEFTPDSLGADNPRFVPLSSPAARDRFMEQVEGVIADGATVLVGGNPYPGPGAYVEPVVFTDIGKGKKGYYDELFGPAFILFQVSSDDEAAELANDTPFGLGAAVFSDDASRAERVAERIDAGMVFINTPEETREYLPFGGVKRSGIGRELGPLAMDEFVNKQLVYKKASIKQPS